MFEPFGMETQEKLFGNPRSVRVDREDLQSGRPPFLNRIADYRPDGRERESWFYQENGMVRFHHLFEYPDPLTQVVVDAGGRNGADSSRTVRRFDNDGRLLEVIRTDFLAPNVSHLTLEYDATGRVKKTRHQVEGKPDLGFMGEFIYEDRKIVQRFYSPDGTFLSQTETSADNGWQTDSVDSFGNWLIRTCFANSPDGAGPKPVARFHRTITYY